MRRLLLILLSLLLLLLLAFFALGRLARPMVERAAGEALGVPVAIDSLAVQPWSGEVVAHGVVLGGGDERIAAASLAATVGVGALLRGEVVVERVEIEAPTATLRFDERYQLVSPAFAAPSTERGEAAAPPPVLREVVVNGGALTLVYPIGKRTRELELAITRFTASDITLPSEGYDGWLHAVFDGTLAGAPLEADTVLRLGGDQSGAGGKLSLSDLVISADLLPLPEQFAGLTARVDADISYETGKGAQTPLFQLDLRVEQPQLSGEEGSKLAARAVNLPGVRVDPGKARIDLGTVEVVALDLDVALTDEGVVLPLVGAGGGDAGSSRGAPSRSLPRSAGEGVREASDAGASRGAPSRSLPGGAGEGGGSPWAVALTSVVLRGGEIRLHRGEESETLALRSARLEGMEPGRRKPLVLEAAVASGGTVRAQGELGLEPPDADFTVRARDLSLPAWGRFLSGLPLALDKGQGDADVRLTYQKDELWLGGRVEGRELRTVPPKADRAGEVLAVHRVAAELVVDPAAEPSVEIATLHLGYPYVMVQRHADGVFPYSLLARGGEPAPEAKPPVEVLARVGRLGVEGGKLEFMDMTLEPPYWTALAGVTMQAEDILVPQSTVSHFAIQGRHDEISPVEITGSFTTLGLELKAEVRDLLLESMNAYVAPLLGYRVTAGRLTLSGVASPSPETLQSVVEVVARGIDVLQTGTDVIQSESGVPLPIALSLISDAAGQIDLTLPISLDTASGKVSIGSVVGQAVRRAIVTALTSPLRILGSLFGTKGAPHSFALAPIPFATGRGDLDDAGEARVAEIGRIVQKNQGLLVITMPQVTAEDLADVGPTGAARLATERQDAVRAALIEEGLPAARLVPSPWSPEVAAKATGGAGVYVELQDGG